MSEDFKQEDLKEPRQEREELELKKAREAAEKMTAKKAAKKKKTPEEIAKEKAEKAEFNRSVEYLTSKRVDEKLAGVLVRKLTKNLTDMGMDAHTAWYYATNRGIEVAEELKPDMSEIDVLARKLMDDGLDGEIARKAAEKVVWESINSKITKLTKEAAEKWFAEDEAEKLAWEEKQRATEPFEEPVQPWEEEEAKQKASQEPTQEPPQEVSIQEAPKQEVTDNIQETQSQEVVTQESPVQETQAQSQGVSTQETVEQEELKFKVGNLDCKNAKNPRICMLITKSEASIFLFSRQTPYFDIGTMQFIFPDGEKATFSMIPESPHNCESPNTRIAHYKDFTIFVLPLKGECWYTVFKGEKLIAHSFTRRDLQPKDVLNAVANRLDKINNFDAYPKKHFTL